jgi:hypothetical protein
MNDRHITSALTYLVTNNVAQKKWLLICDVVILSLDSVHPEYEPNMKAEIFHMFKTHSLMKLCSETYIYSI